MTEKEYLDSKNIATEYIAYIDSKGIWKHMSIKKLLKDYKKQLFIHSVGCSFCGGREFRTTKNYKPAKKCCECSRVRML